MNYKIEAIEILLNEDCILQRYYPLIPYKGMVIEKLKSMGCCTKDDSLSLSDEVLKKAGLPSEEMINLFRRFLVLYDVKESKFKDAETDAFRELYLLPGVKSTRAKLYYDSGYKDLSIIAEALPEQIIRDISEFISRNNLKLLAPLPKEVRTHIAVAKVLTHFSVKGV